jgi:hypothetical protein
MMERGKMPGREESELNAVSLREGWRKEQLEGERRSSQQQ